MTYLSWGASTSLRQRALLENLQPARARSGTAKTWPKGKIEDYLDNNARIHGDKYLNRIRDQAKKLSRSLGLPAEYKVLDALIGAMLGTRDEKKLSSAAAKARAKGVPYDSHRLELFTTLYGALKRQVLPVRPVPKLSEEGLRNLAFFEAYFSNYIEGTEFRGRGGGGYRVSQQADADPPGGCARHPRYLPDRLEQP